MDDDGEYYFYPIIEEEKEAQSHLNRQMSHYCNIMSSLGMYNECMTAQQARALQVSKEPSEETEN